MTSNHAGKFGCGTSVALIGLPQNSKAFDRIHKECAHTLIARRIAERPGPLCTEDIRFLRTYLGHTVLRFKQELGLCVDADIRALSPDSEARLRVLASQRAYVIPPPAHELEALPLQARQDDYAISIDVSDSDNYRLLN